MWTVREGKLLEEAINFCKEKGLEFYAVNSNYPEEKKSHDNFSRKLKADLFIDDRNLGGLPDWGTIYRMVKNKLTFEEIYSEQEDSEERYTKHKGGILGRFFK